MRLPILNRNFELPADGFCQIVPKGEFPIRVEPAQYSRFRNSGALPAAKSIRVIQVVDEVACAAMLNAFQAEAAKPDFVGLLVDREHESCDPKGSTEASAWIMELQNRADGVYAKPRWAGDGEATVKSGGLRFFSPVFLPQDCELLSGDRVRPLRLDEAALTNKPNMRTIKAITNSQNGDECVEADAPQLKNGKAQETGGKESTMDYKSMCAKMLGLPETATDAEIQAACDAHCKKMGNSATELLTLKNRAEAAEAEAAALKKAQLDAQVEKDLDAFKDRITNREEAKALLLKNREDGLKLLGLMKAPEAGQKLLNRDEGKTPDATGAAKTQERETFVEKLRNDRRCSHSEAWALAASAKPELFI